MSWRVMACDGMSCHVMSWHVMAGHVMPCEGMSWHVMVWHRMAWHVMSGMACHVTSRHVMSFHLRSWHGMEWHVMYCHVMAWHVMSCIVMAWCGMSRHSRHVMSFISSHVMFHMYLIAVLHLIWSGLVFVSTLLILNSNLSLLLNVINQLLSNGKL